MANSNHLALLGEGIGAYERWRQMNPAVRLDLRDADLSNFKFPKAHLIGAQLDGAVMEGVDLTMARLDRASLRGTILQGASLDGACFAYANMQKADLERARLLKAVLTGADMTEAGFMYANLSGAMLDDTNLVGAYFLETIFGDTDLSTTRGLDGCVHAGPSVIDHRTLIASGNLPVEFLRGCGIPEVVIDYLPSLLARPIQYRSCFISYSSKDDGFARRLYADLQAHGVRCWFAPEDMKIGDKIRTKIDDMIHVHEKLLLVLSAASVDSTWVEKEVETAFAKEADTGETVLFPIRLDDEVMAVKSGWAADIRRSRHIGDFRRWKDYDPYSTGLARLLRDLKNP